VVFKTAFLPFLLYPRLHERPYFPGLQPSVLSVSISGYLR